MVTLAFMKTPMKLTISKADRRTLEKWVKSRSVGTKQKLRARIVLMTADGLPTSHLMQKLKVSNPTLRSCLVKTHAHLATMMRSMAIRTIFSAVSFRTS